MKALPFETYGPPPLLSIREVPPTALQKGEALVQLKGSSINPSDVGTVAGRFDSQLPMIPGRDFGGMINQSWEGFQVGYLHVSEPDTNPVDKGARLWLILSQA